jgi:hypothetical protein
LPRHDVHIKYASRDLSSIMDNSATGCRFMLLSFKLSLESDSLLVYVMMYCSYVLFAFRLLLVAILAQSRHGLSSRVCHPAHLPHASRIMPLSQWSSSQQMISMSGQINPALLGRKYHGTRRELGIQYKRHLLIACTGYLVYCRRLLMSSWL